MKAGRKNIAKLQSVVSQARAERVNSDVAIRANRLIGYDAQETVSMVSDVLDFVIDFNLREPHSEITPAIERGMTFVLEYARDALRLQERELDGAIEKA